MLVVDSSEGSGTVDGVGDDVVITVVTSLLSLRSLSGQSGVHDTPLTSKWSSGQNPAKRKHFKTP